MQMTPELRSLVVNVGTIAIEVLVVVLLLVILNVILKRTIAGISASPALERWGNIAARIRSNLRMFLIGVGLLAVTAIVGINLYLMHLGEDLPAYTMQLLKSIPQEFWISTGIAIAKVLGLLIAAAILINYLKRGLAFLCKKAIDFEGIRANDESVTRFFATLGRTIGVGTWLTALAIASAWLGLPHVVHATLILALRIFLIISVGLLILRALGALIDSADALSEKYIAQSRFADAYERLRPLVPLFRRSIEYVVMVTVASLVLLQIEAVQSLAEWGPRIIRIIGIVFLSRVAKELVHFLMEETLLNKEGMSNHERQRRATMVPLFRSIVTYLIYFTAGILILKEIGVDPTPILAGAGIVGLAVGLGAQNLINDMVCGFFILFEEHFLVGDFIRLGEAEGIVESIDLRTTRIRDNAGRHHIVRNGQIVEVVHFSKEFTNAVVDVGVAYESDLNKVFAVLKEAGVKLRERNDKVLAETEVKGLDNFGESELTIRTVTRVKPGCHLQVERDLRKGIKDAFDEHGIEIPYARRVLIMQNEGEPEST
ncbi:MAG: mechanosensitive ion channel family protein [Woeseia sp.]